MSKVLVAYNAVSDQLASYFVVARLFLDINMTTKLDVLSTYVHTFRFNCKTIQNVRREYVPRRGGISTLCYHRDLWSHLASVPLGLVNQL